MEVKYNYNIRYQISILIPSRDSHNIHYIAIKGIAYSILFVSFYLLYQTLNTNFGHECSEITKIN